MAKTATTTTRTLTDTQKKVLRLASRKQGVTRAEVRKALGYEDGANIAVQTMVKSLAAKLGMEFVSEDLPREGAPTLGVYAIRPLRSAAMRTRRSARKSA